MINILPDALGIKSNRVHYTVKYSREILVSLYTQQVLGIATRHINITGKLCVFLVFSFNFTKSNSIFSHLRHYFENVLKSKVST